MSPFPVRLEEWTTLQPQYSVYMDRELIGVLEFGGHVFLASVAFPTEGFASWLPHHYLVPPLRARAAEGIASMLREIFPTGPARARN